MKRKRDIFLSRRKDFRRVVRSRKKDAAGCWAMHYAPSRRPAARIGVSVSKRFLRSAVRRNRLRRVIRESFRQQWRAALPPMDAVLSLVDKPGDEKTACALCEKLLSGALAKK